MSSDPRSGAPSSDPEAGGAVVAGSGAEPPLPRETTSDLPTLIRARGATLLDALELHLPGAREHADGAASYAFAAAVEIGAGRRSAESIRETARLHEIGKIYVPTSVLAKGAEELDQKKRALLESIPANGAELARGAGIPGEACAWIGETGERRPERERRRADPARVADHPRRVRLRCRPQCGGARVWAAAARRSDRRASGRGGPRARPTRGRRPGGDAGSRRRPRLGEPSGEGRLTWRNPRSLGSWIRRSGDLGQHPVHPLGVQLPQQQLRPRLVRYPEGNRLRDYAWVSPRIPGLSHAHRAVEDLLECVEMGDAGGNRRRRVTTDRLTRRPQTIRRPR